MTILGDLHMSHVIKGKWINIVTYHLTHCIYMLHDVVCVYIYIIHIIYIYIHIYIYRNTYIYI